MQARLPRAATSSLSIQITSAGRWIRGISGRPASLPAKRPTSMRRVPLKLPTPCVPHKGNVTFLSPWHPLCAYTFCAHLAFSSIRTRIQGTVVRFRESFEHERERNTGLLEIRFKLGIAGSLSLSTFDFSRHRVSLRGAFSGIVSGRHFDGSHLVPPHAFRPYST